MLFHEKKRKKKCPVCGELYFNSDMTFVKIGDNVSTIRKTTLAEGAIVIEGLCPKCLMAATYGAIAMIYNAPPPK